MLKITNVLKEGGEWSLTRCISLLGYTAFLVGSAYLLYKNQAWDGYSTFANLTGGGGALTQVMNKFINGKYNTPEGEAGKPL